MALPNTTNYGNITINYNIKNLTKTTKGLQKPKRNKTIKENYCQFKNNFCDICFIFIMIFVIIVVIIFTILLNILLKSLKNSLLFNKAVIDF